MKTLPKTSSEVRTYEFPFAMQPEFEAGATITTVDSVSSIPTGGAGDIVLSNATLSGTSVFITITAGVIGRRYLLDAKITLSTGSKLEAAGILSIVDPALPAV